MGAAAGRLFQLLLLAVATWGVAYARLALGPLQEAMRVDLTLNDSQMAWLQGPALAVPMALCSIPVGLLVDRYSRAWLFVLFTALSMAATILAAFAPNLTFLVAARCLLGVAVAGIFVAAYSMVADLYSPEQRGRATMVVAIGEIGGAPVAFALGGVLLAAGGSMLEVGLTGWRSALLRMSLVLLPVVLLMLLVREPPRAELVEKNPPVSEVWPELWRYRSVIGPLLVARIMVWIADGAVLVWAAPSFTRRFGLPPDRIGALMGTALLVSGLLGPILGGSLADLCQRSGGPRRTVVALAGLALLSTAAAPFTLMPNAALGGLLLTAFLTLGYMLGTAGITLATVVVPSELRGLYLALTVTVGALFFIGVAPLAVSSLAGAFGGSAMIGQALGVVCGVTSLLGASVLAFSRRYFPPAGVPLKSDADLELVRNAS